MQSAQALTLALLSTSLLAATSCSSIPTVIRSQADADGLEEVRIAGHPKIGDEIHVGDFWIQIRGHTARLFEAHTLEGSTRTEWTCQDLLFHGADAQRSSSRGIRCRTRRSPQGFRWVNSSSTYGRNPPVTELSFRTSDAIYSAYLVHAPERVRLFLPTDDQHEALPARVSEVLDGQNLMLLWG